MKLQKHAANLFAIEDFLSKQDCRNYIELSEAGGYEAAKINTDSGQKVVTNVRNNNRFFYESEELAQLLWGKLKSFIPEKVGNSHAIGLNELFRFYRYQPGQQFKGHFDESFIRNGTEASYFTFMIYLNNDFEGGATTFSDLWVKPEQGMALIFKHDIYHSGREVTKGTKYVLRTDVMYRLIDED